MATKTPSEAAFAMADRLAAKSVREDVIPVSRRDLITAWAFLERLVVSMRKIGSAYTTTDEHTPLSEDQRRHMLADLDRFLDAGLFRDAANARCALADYLPDEESEVISDGLDFFEPSPPTSPSAS